MAQIIKRGGLFCAMAAEIDTDAKADEFIIMCFENCQFRSSLELWGKTLILQIVNYRLNLVKQKVNESIVKNSFPLYHPSSL